MTSNMDAFNELCGWVFATLYATHPRWATLRIEDVPEGTRAKLEAVSPSQRDRDLFWVQALDWLESEGFITIRSKSLSNPKRDGVTLTMMGFRALNAVPDNLRRQETIGDLLIEQLKDGAKETRGAVISGLVGAAMGAAAKAFSGI